METKRPSLKPMYTIGHSNIPLEELISLLEENEIEILVDVRSVPYSKYVSQANKETLEVAVRAKEIKYLFMVKQLGGKPDGVEIEDDHGNINYSHLKEKSSFKEGLERLLAGANDYILCLMCSEEDPSKCYRGMLLAKEFTKRGVEMRHIRHGGEVESQQAIEERMPAAQKYLF